MFVRMTERPRSIAELHKGGVSRREKREENEEACAAVVESTFGCSSRDPGLRIRVARVGTHRDANLGARDHWVGAGKLREGRAASRITGRSPTPQASTVR